MTGKRSAQAGCLSFTTDYGLADGFVAACHGVILRAVPDAKIIDVTHLVPPGDVRRGAMVLAQTVDSLPEGVHLAVVDPGVGTGRRAVALRAPRGFLVGPDNGLLMPAADRLGGLVEAVVLPVPPGVPATFHGRDVFAPAAAALASGRRLAELGEAVPTGVLHRLPPALARLRSDDGHGTDVLETEVVLVDAFGNVQLAATGELLAAAGLRPGARATARVARRRPSDVDLAVGVTFGSVGPGEPVLYVDSAGMTAIAVRDGDAARTLRLGVGDRLELWRR